MRENVTNNKVIVILGMHRSGTSLVGNIIHSLGISLGDDLIVPDLNNQAGYFEHAGIVRLHAELLEIIDRRWTGPKGTLEYPTEWWQIPEVGNLAKQLKDIVVIETAKTHSIWGFKDPRVSRLIPLWRHIFLDLDIEPNYVLSVRDPLAVAESVLRRDAIESPRSQLLWLMHNLDALRDSANQLKCVVDYDRWFTEPTQQLKQMATSIGIPAVDDETTEIITRIIRPDLRHARKREYWYLPFVRELFTLLENSARSGYIPDEVWGIDEQVQCSKELFQSWSEFIESSETPIRRKPSQQSDRGGAKVPTLARIRSRVKRSLTS